MTTYTIPAELATVMSISADRAVSNTTVVFLAGAVPLVQEKLAKGFEEAYISREQLSEATGLAAGHILSETYPKQVEEAGMVLMTERGEFGMVGTGERWRGKACRYVLNPDEYRPKDIPDLELETAPYTHVLDEDAIRSALSPTFTMWERNWRAYRLATALLHHVGVRKVKLNPKQAAEVLGKGRITGWRALRDLAALKLARPVEGEHNTWWVDLTVAFMDPSWHYKDPETVRRTREAKDLRASIFTVQGWGIRSMARTMRDQLPTLPGPVDPGHTRRMRSLRSAVIHCMERMRVDPSYTGTGVTRMGNNYS